jgi:hypothetical protein
MCTEISGSHGREYGNNSLLGYCADDRGGTHLPDIGQLVPTSVAHYPSTLSPSFSSATCSYPVSKLQAVCGLQWINIDDFFKDYLLRHIEMAGKLKEGRGKDVHTKCCNKKTCMLPEGPHFVSLLI